MKKNITVIAGDGIGPEIIQQTIAVLDVVAVQFGHQFQYDHRLMGACAIYETGLPLPEDTLQSCYQSDAILLGAVGDPYFDNNPSAPVRPEQGLLELRKKLQLYANIRPVKLYTELNHLSPIKEEKLKDVDFVIVRELTGGIYFGDKETDEAGNFASDICRYSRAEIERVAIVAFTYATERNKKLTLVDKANVLATSRLWRKIIKEMAENYPDVTVDYLYVDNAAMQLILSPQQFDVILTENMFGDILSDEASVLTGSLGILPSASIGIGPALFEPVHGSYPQAKGLNIANPIGTILSAAMMLDFFGLHLEGATIRKAVQHLIRKGIVTKDLQPSQYYSTTQIGDALCDYLRSDGREEGHAENITLGQSTII